MSALRSPVVRRRVRTETEALAHVLKTHQVDAIVGERDVMLVRLRQVEAELEQSRDELRALAGRLQVQRDHERAAIAREIHDEMGQALTSLQFGLSWMAQALPVTQPVQTKIRALSALVTTTIRSVKRIAVELRPGVLDELGLVKTLQSEVRAFQGHTGIRCAFKTNLSKAACSPAASLAIFRIAQAALTNVARHARASRAGMTLITRGPDVVLTVTDNGRGLVRKTIGNGDALGIVGMRERAMALDGTLTLSGPGVTGTTVTVRLPLSRVLTSST